MGACKDPAYLGRWSPRLLLLVCVCVCVVAGRCMQILLTGVFFFPLSPLPEFWYTALKGFLAAAKYWPHGCRNTDATPRHQKEIFM